MMTQNIQTTIQPPIPGNVSSGAGNNKIYNTVFQGYPDILNVQQVGELLNVSTKTVYRLLNNGALDSLKVGRAYKIPKLYVLQYIKVLDLAQ